MLCKPIRSRSVSKSPQSRELLNRRNPIVPRRVGFSVDKEGKFGLKPLNPNGRSNSDEKESDVSVVA